MTSYKQGFSAVEVLIVLVVLGLVGGLGYVYVSNMNKPKSSDSSQATTTEKPAVTAIKSTADIDKATAELDSLDVSDTSSASSLNKSTSGL